MDADPPPQPLDYLSTATKPRPWSRRKRIVVAVLVLTGAIVLFQVGVGVVFVASNINNR